MAAGYGKARRLSFPSACVPNEKPERVNRKKEPLCYI